MTKNSPRPQDDKTLIDAYYALSDQFEKDKGFAGGLDGAAALADLRQRWLNSGGIENTLPSIEYSTQCGRTIVRFPNP